MSETIEFIKEINIQKLNMYLHTGNDQLENFYFLKMPVIIPTNIQNISQNI